MHKNTCCIPVSLLLDTGGIVNLSVASTTSYKPVLSGIVESKFGGKVCREARGELLLGNLGDGKGDPFGEGRGEVDLDDAASVSGGFCSRSGLATGGGVLESRTCSSAFPGKLGNGFLGGSGLSLRSFPTFKGPFLLLGFGAAGLGGAVLITVSALSYISAPNPSDALSLHPPASEISEMPFLLPFTKLLSSSSESW